MYWHTSRNLRGPLSRDRACWLIRVSEAQSGEALRRLRPAPDDEIRADLVARVRREIAEGRYDTDDKWEAALERLLAAADRP